MTDDSARLSRYVLALARVQPSQAHEALGQLGNLSLQVSLIAEYLKRATPVDPDAHAKLDVTTARATSAVREVQKVLERLLDQTRRVGASNEPTDVRDVLQRVEELVEPFSRKGDVQWSLELPQEAVMWEGDRNVLREALVVALVEAVDSVPKGGRLGCRFDLDGTLTVRGAASRGWAAFLEEALGADPVAAGSASGDPAAAVRLPIRARAAQGSKWPTP